MGYRYFVHFRHGISVFANFSYGTAVLGTPQCPSPDAHANHVELFRATSLCMISCSAAVGCFHDLLIMIDESRFVIGLHQTCPFVVPRLFPSVEKRDKPSLTYISLKKQPTFVSPPNMMSVSERTLIFYPNARSLATFLKAVVYVVKH